MAETARREQEHNRRYCWLGSLTRSRARRLIASSRLLVLSSIMEGGANVISEAIVDGTPVLASRIDGSIGLLGADYPGYFEVGDTEGLARLLVRAETDRAFYRALKQACAARAPLFHPSRERTAWRRLLKEITR
jgi:glycosyltransferase involved in cell wall biosynthesis